MYFVYSAVVLFLFVGLIYVLGKTVWIAPRADHKEKTETSVVLPNDQYADVF